ncbi:MAG: DUF2470 domain-containing protein [Alphaproteobacteria bacterium]
MSDEDREAIAAAARYLVRAAARGCLATIMREASGAPYASLVAIATDHDGSPILLISDLADHTKNLKADDRISLLVTGDDHQEDPLAGERLSLLGRLQRSDSPGLRQRYLARHPKAAFYADFGDFGFYRMTIDKAHLVAGFGRIHWIGGDHLTVPAADALVAAEGDIVAHMNEDHSDALDLYATRLLGRGDGDWRMTGVDREGIDLRKGSETARLGFAGPLNDSTDVRKELIRLVNKARDS